MPVFGAQAPGQQENLRIALDDRGTNSTAAVTPPRDARRIRRLMLYFGMVYACRRCIGQTDGIIAQPLTYYFKEVHSLTPVQVTAALTAFNFPWIIKPVYGLVSDFVPLFGYRRKSQAF
jgi:hypothetical protein